MLAYLLWHRPREGVEREAYERAAERFHRSLAHSPPAGFRGSALYRVAELPWLEGGGYEDWYLVEDFAALGVLNAAAVAHGHRGAHEEVARRYGAAAGGLYGLLEGCPRLGRWSPVTESIGTADTLPGAAVSGLPALVPATPGAEASGPLEPVPATPRAATSLAIWISRPPGTSGPELGELLGDGMDPACSSLWRRSLVLGPAPEYCLLAPESPAGVAPTRLPAGWIASTVAREPVWHGGRDG
ncbi:MAG TPA: hypothetical protein VMU32_09230 [Solirubrobacteraceae bacterium]|nr:hypothetical protein [Solirubrobacteraceae bacterium]